MSQRQAGRDVMKTLLPPAPSPPDAARTNAVKTDQLAACDGTPDADELSHTAIKPQFLSKAAFMSSRTQRLRSEVEVHSQCASKPDDLLDQCSLLHSLLLDF